MSNLKANRIQVGRPLEKVTQVNMSLIEEGYFDVELKSGQKLLETINGGFLGCGDVKVVLGNVDRVESDGKDTTISLKTPSVCKIFDTPKHDSTGERVVSYTRIVECGI